MGDVAMLSLDILLAMATRDMLIKQGIIPADIMKIACAAQLPKVQAQVQAYEYKKYIKYKKIKR